MSDYAPVSFASLLQSLLDKLLYFREQLMRLKFPIIHGNSLCKN